MEQRVEHIEPPVERVRAHLTEQLGLPEGFVQVLGENHLRTTKSEEGTWHHDGHSQLGYDIEISGLTYAFETWGTREDDAPCGEVTRLYVTPHCDPAEVVAKFREGDVRFAVTRERHRLRLGDQAEQF